MVFDPKTAYTAIAWTIVLGTSESLLPMTGYVPNNAGLVTLTLPAAADTNFADRILVVGKGAGGWRIAQPAGIQITFGNRKTTLGVGGYLQSTNPTDRVELLCTEGSFEWTVVNSGGNITVV